MAKILVVEDEEKIARFIELELQHEGYERIRRQMGVPALRKRKAARMISCCSILCSPASTGLRFCAG